ncbi:hypothetical protein AB0H00_15255 [Nocardia sp. NPDC023852]|uniref:hypothetical protein n=1 Tax=Nocardia sp. NPDC023852 TaxID=3154697 RepID=UPI0033D9A870
MRVADRKRTAGESCALLATATQLLATTNNTEASTMLDELLQHDLSNTPHRNIWQRRFLPAKDFCSPGLHAAITAYTHAHPNPPLGRRPRTR